MTTRNRELAGIIDDSGNITATHNKFPQLLPMLIIY
jgi:hypothetical protein